MFSEYYSNNHSPSSALKMYKINLQSKHGDEYFKIIADGSKCPTRKWCYDLYITEFLINNMGHHLVNKWLYV
jgi:hypothetical protein